MENNNNEKKHYKIGYTTGVFDQLHKGHVRIIERAKEQCDYLIVGVSTDELVMQQKNKIPIDSFADRCEMVAALKWVDEVVPQYNKDKFAAWTKYHFNAMFVGDDWKGSAIFEKAEQQLKKVGVDVVYFERTKGISSTLLRQRMQKRFLGDLGRDKALREAAKQAILEAELQQEGVIVPNPFFYVPQNGENASTQEGKTEQAGIITPNPFSDVPNTTKIEHAGIVIPHSISGLSKDDDNER